MYIIEAYRIYTHTIMWTDEHLIYMPCACVHGVYPGYKVPRLYSTFCISWGYIILKFHCSFKTRQERTSICYGYIKTDVVH